MENQIEVWKPIKNYEGFYEVSNLGNIKSLSRVMNNSVGSFISKERFLSTKKTKHGYLEVFLSKHGNTKCFLVHRLVASSFFHKDLTSRFIVVNHKNFIRTDNNLENLEIISQRENTNKKHIKSSSKYTGVSYRKDSDKWRATILVNGKAKSLGSFITEIEAHFAYQEELASLQELENEISKFNNQQYV
jgi:hypothetical protein